jgi:methylamine utilization protein MauE
VDYLALALRLTLAFVFLAALAGKLSGRQAVAAFGRMLSDLGVPSGLLGLVGGVLVAAEASVFALAPWEATGLVGSLVAVVLLAALTGGVAMAVRRGSTANCRCFGSRRQRLGSVHVVRNATLTAVAAAATTATVLADGRALHPIGVTLSVAAATLATLVIVYWEDLAAVVLGPPGVPIPSRRS